MSGGHHVVIVGGGFAGLNAAKALSRAPARVTLIDRRNHHLFQPLLYQVATGGLSPADIATPIRALMRGQKNARVILGEVVEVHVDPGQVVLSDGDKIDYDTLVLATGARHSYFGKEEWAEAAPGLKTLEDAAEIRRRIFFAFEAAERATDPEDRRAWLTFVIVGGGPTGVELAGAIGELARSTLKDNFRSFDPANARILLFEGSDRVLTTYHPRLSEKALSALGDLGVTVRTGALVRGVTPDGVEISAGDQSQRISCKTVIWAAGVSASSLAGSIAVGTGAELDRAGRLIVEPDLTVVDHPEIFVLGDMPSFSHQTGHPLRGTADVAKAQGSYVGKAISRRLRSKKVDPFKFRDLGKLAVIGRSQAVAELPGIRLSGFLAWWSWLLVHLILLVDFQNRLTVFVQWGWNYLTRNRSARLITGRRQSIFLEPEAGPVDHSLISNPESLPIDGLARAQGYKKSRKCTSVGPTRDFDGATDLPSSLP